jgi:hypothetical protein
MQGRLSVLTTEWFASAGGFFHATQFHFSWAKDGVRVTGLENPQPRTMMLMCGSKLNRPLER